jgi:hypothetical protein
VKDYRIGESTMERMTVVKLLIGVIGLLIGFILASVFILNFMVEAAASLCGTEPCNSARELRRLDKQVYVLELPYDVIDGRKQLVMPVNASE